MYRERVNKEKTKQNQWLRTMVLKKPCKIKHLTRTPFG